MYTGNDAHGNYVVYFDRLDPCPPVPEDPILNDPNFRNVADELLVRSNLQDVPANRSEHQAIVWQNVTTGAIRYDITFLGAGPCSISLAIPVNTDSERVLGVLHTHPHYRGDNMTMCNPNALPYNPDANGGGSQADWDTARRSGVNVYAISPDVFWKLPWLTPDDPQAWAANTNRWRRRGNNCPIK
jgi:hypothetical protein